MVGKMRARKQGEKIADYAAVIAAETARIAAYCDAAYTLGVNPLPAIRTIIGPDCSVMHGASIYHQAIASRLLLHIQSHSGESDKSGHCESVMIYLFDKPGHFDAPFPLPLAEWQAHTLD